MGIYFWRPKWSILFFAGALLISISRVIAGIHWPADVLGGAVVGILSGWLVARLLRMYKKQSIMRMVLLVGFLSVLLLPNFSFAQNPSVRSFIAKPNFVEYEYSAISYFGHSSSHPPVFG